MNTRHSAAVITLLAAAGVPVANAVIINVPGDEPTIQAGIDAAVDGDEVVVADGTYIGAGNKNLAFNDRSLTLRSANGPANCVIDCEDDGRGFFLRNESGTIIVEGITVTRGRVGAASPGGQRGGAVFCVHVFATFVNCIFDDNHAHVGAGVYVAETNTCAVFINCQMTNAVFLADGSPDDIHAGAGAYVRSGAIAEFINCTFADNAVRPNAADHIGGGLHVRIDASVRLANCVLWGNSAFSGDQIGLTLGGIVTVQYSDVQGGEAEVVVVDDGTVNWGDGNIDADALFVNPDSGDYRLQAGSPAIDAGHNWAIAGLTDTDLDGNPRFAADENDFDPGCGIPVVVDMGAYEYQGDPFPVKFGDIDGDGIVGIVDFLALLADWGSCVEECCLADLDIDGVVGVIDFLLLLGNWTA